jgi:mannose-6-phosphate isomerase-like protein (cupin superfamily)
MPSPLSSVNLADAFGRIAEPWLPHVAAELNGQHVKLVKLEGPFVWHRHEGADELFLVVEGKLVIELRDGSVTLEEGEFVVVPRGVEHRPVAEGEAHVVLFEPVGTLNTGSVDSDRTVRTLRRI